MVALVGAVEELVASVRVLKMKITMPHKIQSIDINQGYGNYESIWKD